MNQPIDYSNNILIHSSPNVLIERLAFEVMAKSSPANISEPRLTLFAQTPQTLAGLLSSLNIDTL